MNRTPSVDVLRELRREVGFGCPVADCGNPYLYWHHFDPPWRERQHHEPAGMIALCDEHHRKADAGAFTVEQLRDLKVKARERADQVRGRFDWMRREVLLVVGGAFFLETPVAVQFRNDPVVWLNRDEDGYLLLNVSMLTTVQAPRMVMRDNFWLSLGNPDDLVCPPAGNKLALEYANGDRLLIEFFELDQENIDARYPDLDPERADIELPITAAEVQMTVGGTGVEFGPREMRLPGNNVIRGMVARRCAAGVVFG